MLSKSANIFALSVLLSMEWFVRCSSFLIPLFTYFYDQKSFGVRLIRNDGAVCDFLSVGSHAHGANFPDSESDSVTVIQPQTI